MDLTITIIACILTLPMLLAGGLLLWQKIAAPKKGTLIGHDTGKRFHRF